MKTYQAALVLFIFIPIYNLHSQMNAYSNEEPSSYSNENTDIVAITTSHTQNQDYSYSIDEVKSNNSSIQQDIELSLQYNMIHFSLRGEFIRNLEYKINDYSGTTLSHKRILSSEIDISLAHFELGWYELEIYQGQNLVKSYQLKKSL